VIGEGCCPELPRAGELVERVRAEPWLMTSLEAVAASGLPDAWLGAGVVRDVVWGQLHGGFEPHRVKDLDVGFYDPTDLRIEYDQGSTALLRSLLDRPWEACNQAAVHKWYHRYLGGPKLKPLVNVHEGVAGAAEFATSVALQLDGTRLRVCAPHGLDDLLDGVWRHNPTHATADYFARRLGRQRVAERWPRVQVVELALG
jgi:uncharacterized protein